MYFIPLVSANVRLPGLLESKSPWAWPSVPFTVAFVDFVPEPHCGVQPLVWVNWNCEAARVAVLVSVTDHFKSPAKARLVSRPVVAVQPLISPWTNSARTGAPPNNNPATIICPSVFAFIRTLSFPPAAGRKLSGQYSTKRPPPA